METKISMTSRRISVFLKVCSILMLAIAALGIIGICILTLSGQQTRTSFLAAFDTVTNNGTTISIVPEHLFVILSSMIVYSAFMSVVFYNICMIFKDVSTEHTPFKHKHVARIKRIAILVVAVSVIGNFGDSLLDLFTMNRLTWHIDFSGIILGVIIYCLALFFNYGCVLQQQFDETL